jgi:hypothetical protein
MDIEERAVVGGVGHEQDDELGAAIPSLQGTPPIECLDVSESRFGLDGEIATVECRHAVPCATVPDQRQRHLGPEADIAREQLPEPAEKGKLAGVQAGSASVAARA